MRLGAIIPQGNFSANTWVKIYENELGSAETSVTISNLDGNTDVMYRLIVRAVSAVNGTTFYARPNNDSGANYGYQYVRGVDASADAARSTTYTGYRLGYAESGRLLSVERVIYVKSGYIRTMLGEEISDINGTTILLSALYGLVWNNTTDNITSMVVVGDQASGIGTGTIIELWKPVPKV